MTKQVYVVGYDQQVEELFLGEPGYNLTNFIQTADIMVFTGGEDVSPGLYGEEAIPQTSSNIKRDQHEIATYNRAKPDIFRVGICRGGQFLNVVSGGKMYQHVTNHTRTHKLVDFLTGDEIEVTSTHHQMMIPGPGGEVLAGVVNKLSDVYCNAEDPKGTTNNPDVEAEVIWYGNKNTLCFQPHPEYSHKSTRVYFFDLLDMLTSKKN